MNNISYRYDKDLPEDKVLSLYSELQWSSAEKPSELMSALSNSHSVVSAWVGDKLIGLGNSISDGYLVVYYPHLLVLPEYQGKGVGKRIVSILREKYSNFHQQILVADGRATEFYKRCGFSIAGGCEPLWIYDGHEHD